MEGDEMLAKNAERKRIGCGGRTQEDEYKQWRGADG